MSKDNSISNKSTLMKKEILFIAPYPDHQNIKDGMIQRIKAIDELFVNNKRIYLTLSFTKYIHKNTVRSDENLQILKRNVFIHFFEIIRQLKNANTIYCHAIYNILPILLMFPILKAKIILDIHGVVTDELYLEKKYFKSTIFKFAEKIAFKKIDIAIGVTNSMCSHFKKKYPNYKGEYLVYNIFPESLITCFKEKLITHSETIIIYSGNIQKWQNIDLMLQIIKNNQHRSIRYIILSGEVNKFINLVSEFGINPLNILIKSVRPEELGYYYKIASYGFILRDESIINQVANPTKLIEYLAYGIVPIVLNENIGDYKSYDYEYIHCNEISINLPPRKSNRNVNISKQLLNVNLEMDLPKLILN